MEGIDPIEKSRETWREYPIDFFNSHYHNMKWENPDGNGLGVLTAGKR